MNSKEAELISTIEKSISSYKKSKAFIGYWDAGGFADVMDQTRENIVNLANTSPNEARKLMLDLIKTHAKVIERSDDSNGYIGNFYAQCMEDFGKIFLKLSVDIKEIVKLVCDLFMHDNYGVMGNVISDFKDVLREEGLELLKKNFLELASPRGLEEVKKKAETKFEKEKAKGELDEDDNLQEEVNKKVEYYLDNIERGLAHIADCRNDVDEYIQAQSFHGGLYEYDYLAIAKRMINHARYGEALEWLDKLSKPITTWRDDYLKLKISALSLSGELETAQQERIAWFQADFKYDLYEEILKNANDTFREQFRKQSIEKAFEHKDIYAAIDFLMQLDEVEKCAEFVLLKAESINGAYYELLRPMAKILRNNYPLASTILYRKLTEHSLAKAVSKYYQYAAKDLIACHELSSQITDFGSHKNHEAYFKEIQEKHQRKCAFWDIFYPLMKRKMR
ncbi:hypothetical protein FACS1894122_13220 [Alphaproteobacteria bacterium]|nr:hypothetical protein FACS1894122_13220 [Alphaproteobacteria bacterium]